MAHEQSENAGMENDHNYALWT